MFLSGILELLKEYLLRLLRRGPFLLMDPRRGPGDKQDEVARLRILGILLL